MRKRYLGLAVALLGVLTISPCLHAQSANATKLDFHDLNGNWRGASPSKDITNFSSNDQKIPEPPLTEWGKQHLLYKSISHDALAGTHIPGWDKPGHRCPNNQDPCFSVDQNGVPLNDPNGEYPAKDCEPLSTPAMYDYPGLGSMELLFTREGDRVFQLFEYHREWRTFWFNREHPKDLDPTYEGDSTARWDGNDLIVDTIGYNDKTMVTQNVAHRKSDAFRLVERFHLTDHDHLVIEMDYYDTKAWGDKAWTGFKKYYKRVPKEDFQEFICSPREYQAYDKVVTDPVNKTLGK
jgi:hypothetical protein